MTKRTLAAMSWSSLIRSEVKAKAVATVKEATAIAFSRLRLSVLIEVELWNTPNELVEFWITCVCAVSNNIIVVCFSSV